MIQVHELRFGNKLIFKKTGEIITVIQLLEDSIGFSLQQGNWFKAVDAFEPIPLTPEILEKIGFQDKEDGFWFYHEALNMWFSKNIDQSFSLWVKYEEGFLTDLKYLHQFQNLYFFLKGEELKINL